MIMETNKELDTVAYDAVAGINEWAKKSANNVGFVFLTDRKTSKTLRTKTTTSLDIAVFAVTFFGKMGFDTTDLEYVFMRMFLQDRTSRDAATKIADDMGMETDNNE